MQNRIVNSLQKHNTKFQLLSEQGFSLLEALVGMLVITLVLLAITPPIILSAATRIQNRRAEQAMQLAQGEVDRVRVLVAQSNYKSSDLPIAATFTKPGDITSAPAPTTIGSQVKSNNSNCSKYDGTPVPNSTVLPVDVDGDCKPDFLVQTFRDIGVSSTGATGPVVMLFHIGVRVYSAEAIQGSALSLANPANCASLKFTPGLGNQQSLPLAVLYTTISRSDSTFVSLQNYNTFLSPPAPSPASNCG